MRDLLVGALLVPLALAMGWLLAQVGNGAKTPLTVNAHELQIRNVKRIEESIRPKPAPKNNLLFPQYNASLSDPVESIFKTQRAAQNSILQVPNGQTSRSVNGVILQRFPGEFKAMLAISSDADGTREEVAQEIWKFLRTTDDTIYGPGVELDIADSVFFFAPSSIVSVFGSLGLSTQEPKGFATELIECGWIDTVHSVGEFDGTAVGSEKLSAVRNYSAIATKLIKQRDWSFSVWVSHGSDRNVQNICPDVICAGDDPKSEAYNFDLWRQSGVKFFNRYRGVGGGVVGMKSLMEPLRGKDGAPYWSFRRYFVASDSEGGERYLWQPEDFNEQVHPAILDYIVENGLFTVVGQHLNNIKNPGRAQESLRLGFNRLKSYQNSGLILVTRLSRLLQYNHTNDFIEFDAVVDGSHAAINILGVRDPLFGRKMLTLEEARGQTFVLPQAVRKASISISGHAVPAEYIIERETADGRISLQIAWFSNGEESCKGAYK